MQTPEELGLELLNNTPIGPVSDPDNEVLLRIRHDYILNRLDIGASIKTKLFGKEVMIIPLEPET